jgi:hypothetical protein
MSHAVNLSDIDRFNGLKPHYQERSNYHALTENRITQTDAGLISSFVAEKWITAGISPKRSLKIVSSLITIRRFLPPYKEITVPTIYQAIDLINSAVSSRG